MTFHPNLVIGKLWKVYPDIAARDADSASQTSYHVNHIVRVNNPKSFYSLVSVGPTVWKEELAGTGSGAPFDPSGLITSITANANQVATHEADAAVHVNAADKAALHDGAAQDTALATHVGDVAAHAGASYDDTAITARVTTLEALDHGQLHDPGPQDLAIAANTVAVDAETTRAIAEEARVQGELDTQEAKQNTHEQSLTRPHLPTGGTAAQYPKIAADGVTLEWTDPQSSTAANKIVGIGAPLGTLGQDGDYYHQVDAISPALDGYGPKAGGSWPAASFDFEAEIVKSTTVAVKPDDDTGVAGSSEQVSRTDHKHPLPDIIGDFTLPSSDPDYDKKGMASVEGLDQHLSSRQIKQIFHESASFDFNALGYLDKTVVVVQNINSISGLSIIYGTGGTNDLQRTVSGGSLTTITGQDNFTLTGGQAVLLEKIGTIVCATIFESNKFKWYDTVAVAQVAGLFGFDVLIAIVETEELWIRKTGTAENFSGVVDVNWAKVSTATAPNIVYPGNAGAVQIGKENVYYLDETIGTIPPASTGQEYAVSIVQANLTDAQGVKDVAKAKVSHFRAFDTGAGFIWIETDTVGGSLPIRHYSANGAISDEDQIAILGAGATALTLPASVVDRRIAYTKTHTGAVTITATVEEFIGVTGTSTDQTLNVNEDFRFATLIGNGGGLGWNNFAGLVTQSPTPSTYQLTEYDTGEVWIDGKTIYGQVVTWAGSAIGTHNFSVAIDPLKVIKIEGMANHGGVGWSVSRMHSSTTGINAQVPIGGAGLQLTGVGGFNPTAGGHAIVTYTKP